MRDSVRSLLNSIAIAAACALALTLGSPPTGFRSPPGFFDVGLAAATAGAPAAPPPGALIEQFLVNQIENCSLICPFIVQGAVQVPLNFVPLPLTLVRLLQSGEPFLRAAALSDATVSGALNDAVTGIITNDLGKVLPRAQNALEVAIVGLIDVGTTAVTRPGNLPQAINIARAGLFDALTQPPGTMPPPPVHNAVEAAAVRAVEVASALTFQVPERFLLGVTQAANALFTTVGNTGNVGAALAAVAASVSTTIGDSAGFIGRALTEPIAITPATTTLATTPNAPSQLNAQIRPSTAPLVTVKRPMARPGNTPSDNTLSRSAESAMGGSEPVASVRKPYETSPSSTRSTATPSTASKHPAVGKPHGGPAG